MDGKEKTCRIRSCRTMQCVPAALLFGFLLAISACGFFERETVVSAELPDLPAWWAPYCGEISVRFAWPEEGGGQAGLIAPRWENRDLCLPKLPNVPVLAYPRFRGRELLPAGGLYPVTIEGDERRLRLTWRDGFACALLLSAAQAGMPLDELNGVRFLATAAGRSEGNPWRLDPQRPLAALLAGGFSMYDFSLKDEYPVEAAAGTGMRVLSENLLEGPVEADAAGLLGFPALGLGFHRYFEDMLHTGAEDMRVLGIDVRSQKEIVVISGGG